MRNMQDDGMGGFVCAPGFECQGATCSGTAANPVGGGPEGKVACSISGKNRSGNNMIDDGMGGFRCAPGFECQGASCSEGTGGGAAVCSVSGKSRTMKNLKPDGRGGYRCKPGFECQGASCGQG